jgi:hypothetical protein
MNQSIGFYNDGALSSGYLNKTDTIQVQNNRIYINEYVSFNENGNMDEAHIAKNIKIKTKDIGSIIITNAGIENSISFHPNGMIASVIIGKDKKIKYHQKRLSFKKGDFINFNEKGELILEENPSS